MVGSGHPFPSPPDWHSDWASEVHVARIGAVTYAIAGALLATFTYEFAGVWLFPAAQTERPLPLSPASRMFAYLVVGLIAGSALPSR